MLFNEEDQEYCRYKNNPGNGDVSTNRLFHFSIAAIVRIPIPHSRIWCTIVVVIV